jgi:hypothetical protein
MFAKRAARTPSERVERRKSLAPVGRLSLALSVVVFLFALTGCQDFVIYDVIQGEGVSGGPLTISPISAVVPVSGKMVFFASGGQSPYRFSMVSGSGTIDSQTGQYTAPDTPGTDEIRLTDDDGATVEAQTIIVD